MAAPVSRYLSAIMKIICLRYLYKIFPFHFTRIICSICRKWCWLKRLFCVLYTCLFVFCLVFFFIFYTSAQFFIVTRCWCQFHHWCINAKQIRPHQHKNRIVHTCHINYQYSNSKSSTRLASLDLSVYMSGANVYAASLIPQSLLSVWKT